MILTAENISYTVPVEGKKSFELLKDITIHIPENSLTGITGESGAGKTTLAKILTGHIEPSSGSVKILVPKRNNIPPVQLLFQNTRDIINPYRRIADVITEAACLSGISGKAAREETERIFGLLKMSRDVWNSRGYQLSGGEQQRAALARLLALKPKLLILDEPFAAQDVESQVNLLHLLKKIKDEFGLSILCISHNLRILKNLADTIYIMRNGRIIESGNTSVVLSNPQNEYTRMLLKAEKYTLGDEEISMLLKSTS